MNITTSDLDISTLLVREEMTKLYGGRSSFSHRAFNPQPEPPKALSKRLSTRIRLRRRLALRRRF